MDKVFGIQLYSISKHTKEDFPGALEKVAKMGYDAVELAGYDNISAQDLKAKLDSLNLKVFGSHEGLNRLENNLQEVLDYNKAIGNKYIVCPWANGETEQGWLELAEKLDKIGAQCKKQGFELLYHNHAHELETKIGDKYALDIILEKENIGAQFDLFWVEFAGVNICEYIKKYKDKCKLLHFKEMAKDDRTKNDIIGEGVIDYKEILDVCEGMNVECFIVEQESSKTEIIDDIAKSIVYLKSL